jgi:hypothetical protein
VQRHEGDKMSEIEFNPYEIYKGMDLWKIVDGSVADLVENGDIVEMTRRDYIVGYLCKNLQQASSKPEQR